MTLIPPMPEPTGAAAVRTIDLTKRFGAFTALDSVSVSIAAGSVHALLGENGAGKSTLVKCLVGYYLPDEGSVLIDEREQAITSPQKARALGLGMVYQHFTLVPSMTVAENLVMAKGDAPALIRWGPAREALAAFMKTTPFSLDLDARIANLSAGQKQKVEILKQLYARNRFLVLDEPTSVLTPEEADEMLGAVRDLAHGGALTVLMITHKFREVLQFADGVSVLRRGRHVGSGAVADFDADRLAELMIGGARERVAVGRTGSAADQAPVLQVRDLTGDNDAGLPAVRGVTLQVAPGEIVGIAGVSGNGQRELIEMLLGQRDIGGGTVTVFGEPYHATRAEIARHRIGSLPEEPLRNASVAKLSVAQNMALRNFDAAPLARGRWLDRQALIEQAAGWIRDFGVKTRSPQEPIANLSGGNVQRSVLARELSRQARLLIVMNPVFGLDFAAVDEIHGRLVDARNGGTAVLLVSEDLDELIELSDRVLVMSEGRIVFQTAQPAADRAQIGRSMGGHHLEEAAAAG
ncbi:MAG TPA: ABC transporter ATP-binding protein [Burkholderiaceae bacterium]|nr:ABC transporter ATP-binding protein [Burkholderiaceae bacterium]